MHTLYIKQGETVLASKEVTLASSSESKINNEEISLPDKVQKYVNIKVDNGEIDIIKL